MKHKYDVLVDKHIQKHYPMTRRAPDCNSDVDKDEYESDDSDMRLYNKQQKAQLMWARKAKGLQPLIERNDRGIRRGASAE